MIGRLSITKPSEIPVRPNTLKVTHESVLRLSQAISLASAEQTNIATHSQLMIRQPSSVSYTHLTLPTKA